MSVSIPSKVFSKHTGGVAVIQEMDSTAEHPANARAQLLSTKQTILEISESLGFSSQSFFGKYFKRGSLPTLDRTFRQLLFSPEF